MSLTPRIPGSTWEQRGYRAAEMRQALGDPGFTVRDGTLVIAQEFRLVDD